MGQSHAANVQPVFRRIRGGAGSCVGIPHRFRVMQGIPGVSVSLLT